MKSACASAEISFRKQVITMKTPDASILHEEVPCCSMKRAALRPRCTTSTCALPQLDLKWKLTRLQRGFLSCNPASVHVSYVSCIVFSPPGPPRNRPSSPRRLPPVLTLRDVAASRLRSRLELDRAWGFVQTCWRRDPRASDPKASNPCTLGCLCTEVPRPDRRGLPACESGHGQRRLGWLRVKFGSSDHKCLSVF